VAGSLNAPAFALTGKDQQLAVPLPALALSDTTCGSALHLTIAVHLSTIVAGQSHDLVLPVITLRPADATASVTAPLTMTDGQARATLAVPTRRQASIAWQPAVTPAATGASGAVRATPAAPTAQDGAMTWQPSVTVLLPANAYAGPYTVTMTVGVAP
jgi:hypothetical protein